MAIPNQNEFIEGVKIGARIGVGIVKSFMTMKVDEGLLESGFDAAKMGIDKVCDG